MKIVNVKGITILVIVLLVIHFAFGLFLSPALGKIVIKNLNKYTDTKISTGRISVWPLMFSCSISDLKVYDPDNEKKIMMAVKKASLRLSIIALLSRRIGISSLVLSGVDMNLESEPDGSFNVQKIAPAKGEDKPETSILDRFKGKKDWFGRIFDAVKKRSKKEKAEKEQAAKAPARKVEKEVVELPKGKRVKFRTERSGYLLEIGKLSIRNANISVKADKGQTIDIKKASVVMSGMGVDPKKGTRFDRMSAAGRLEKAGSPAGNFSLAYASRAGKTSFDLSANDVDLPAIGFVYEDSLPVQVNKGIISIRSDTNIIKGQLKSKNSLVLTKQDLATKAGAQPSVTFATTPLIVEALNSIDPVKLDFTITGTPDNPKFEGFEKSLMKLVQPKLGDVTKDIQKKGMQMFEGFMKKDAGETAGEAQQEGTQQEGESAAQEQTQKAVESIKSLFE